MSKTPTVIVTRRWPSVVEDELREMCADVRLNEEDRPMSRGELQDALRSADCVLPTVTDPMDAETLGADGIRCQFLGNFGVGFNHIDLDAAKKAGIRVTNTPEVLTDCTADIAMILMLTAARRIGEGERHVRANAWSGWRPTHMLGTKVTGKTLGLVGFGRIACAVARRAHFGFGMKILFHDPFEPPEKAVREVGATSYPTLEEMIPDADFLSLHCPGGDKTRHLMNRERIALMKPGSFLINTARGDVIDNQALIEALKKGVIAGAGLDVFEGEPNLDPGFLELENAVLLPHLGSASRETRIAMGRRVLKNLRAWLDGGDLPDRVA
ncbi:MAG: D-glycerate dehydrogenase [Gammaproteobacteria bacterium]|nr:D-glycerate dehydrogenase [Gammaproteobacteria bacterium]